MVCLCTLITGCTFRALHKNEICLEAQRACTIADDFALKEFPKIPSSKKGAAIQQMQQLVKYCQECKQRCEESLQQKNNPPSSQKSKIED
jgi:hypothetical protein